MFYIDEIGGPDQLYYVSLKVLEIPLLLFLREFDTYCRSDTTAVHIHFYHGPPCDIEKKKSRNT